MDLQMHSGVLGDTVERLSDRKSYAQLYPMQRLWKLTVFKGISAVQNQAFIQECFYCTQEPTSVGSLGIAIGVVLENTLGKRKNTNNLIRN